MSRTDKTITEIQKISEDINAPLLDWFSSHARILPWRDQPTAYRVWISEIMLQQTRVEAVKPYYERFLKAFPDIRALAAADDDHLMKMWEGLGYYNRARNLKKAAMILEEQYRGEMPRNYELILSLPGIGSYTAGAISSIAYGIARPAVDGNVLRVWARLYRSDVDVLKQSVKSALETELLNIIPKDSPGAFNQALMELGATVCLPNGQPECIKCPLAFMCMAHKAGCETDYPKKSPKKSRKTEQRTVFIIRCGEETLIRKRPPKGLLAGLYELPSADGWLSEKQALEHIKSLGFAPLHILKLTDAKHIFSHVEWHMKGYAVQIDELALASKQLNENGIFILPELAGRDYPIPSAFAAYMEYLNIHIGIHSS